MHKAKIVTLFLGLIALLCVACGGSDAPPAKETTSVKSPSTSASSPGTTLKDYAAKHAGGPGAIYVGDFTQLVGPAQTPEQGGFDGGVPIESIEKNRWLFESDYYQEILKKANLLNPTPMTSTGVSIEIQHACINRALLPCMMVAETLAPNLFERTNGQIDIQISSFPELGLSGTDTISLVSAGTLGMANVYSGYVAGELPAIEIQSLWGMFATQKDQYDVTTAIHDDLETLVSEAANGAVIVNHNWYAGIDQFFFCHDKLTTLDDFKGKKTRSHSAAISDWIEGMGASAQFVAFAEVYTALERGVLDCGVTVAFAAHGQRWYEVSKYMVGPLSSQLITNLIMNKDIYADFPPDMQQILIEEGAKHELEAMRVTPAWNEVWTQRLQDEGLILNEFTPEMIDHMKNVAVMQHVIPGFVNRVGGGDAPIIKIFNEKASHIVGLKINLDGSTTTVPITE